MKLKKIKPNTAIHCTDKEQIEYLVKNKIVDVWALEKGVPVWLASYKDNRIHSWMPEHDGKQTGEEYYKSVGLICIEFSDLILPETMTEEEAYKKGREDAFEEVKNCEMYGYDCGLKDAWELARKLAKCSPKELDEMYFSSLTHALVEHTYHEALAKVEAYEKEQAEIKVGDVVERDGRGIHIVTHINTEEDSYTLINNKGRATVAHRRQIYKTGKNFGVDIKICRKKILAKENEIREYIEELRHKANTLIKSGYATSGISTHFNKSADLIEELLEYKLIVGSIIKRL